MAMEIDKIKEELSSVSTKEINYSELAEILKRKKAEAVKLSDEPLAKEIWILEQVCKIQQRYLEAFNKIKQRDFYNAWCLLEKAEIGLLFLKKHFSINENPYQLKFINDVIRKYQSIYPYRLFFSTELIEKEKECSICGKVYKLRDSCGHITGEIYNGELCLWKVTKSELVGVAVVENPVHKYAVAFLKSGEGEGVEDNYDYSSLEYLMKLINQPFDTWDIDFVVKYVSHNLFKTYSPDETCPCNQTDKTYSECCLKEKGVKSLFHEFVVEKPSKEIILPNSIAIKLSK